MATPGTADLLLRHVTVIDGTGAPPLLGDVAVSEGRIAAVGDLSGWRATEEIDGGGRVLSPGFIDVHTHDDTTVIDAPEMLPKLSQGVTTVVVGNCGISAAPVALSGEPPDPMNLLGPRRRLPLPDLRRLRAPRWRPRAPAVNVARAGGAHGAAQQPPRSPRSRGQPRPRSRPCAPQLDEALAHGALGPEHRPGLRHRPPRRPPTSCWRWPSRWPRPAALYTTHLRTEFAGILDALDEAFRIGRHARVPVVVSHLKCAGVDNWGRSARGPGRAGTRRAGTSAVGLRLLPLQRQLVDARPRAGDRSDRHPRSPGPTPHPELGGKLLAEIAARVGRRPAWTAARRLQPAGAVYHGMSRRGRATASSLTPAPPSARTACPTIRGRTRGCGARSRACWATTAASRSCSPCAEAVRKMTSLSADRFGLADRGHVRARATAPISCSSIRTPCATWPPSPIPCARPRASPRSGSTASCRTNRGKARTW